MRITPDTLAEVPKIRDVAVSPDGGTVALVVEVCDGARYRDSLFHVAADGSGAPEEIDLGGLEPSGPAYLSDGSLVFLSSPPEALSEPEARSVYLLAPGGGPARCLLTVPGGISEMEVAPSGWVLVRAWLFPRAADLAEDRKSVV